MAADVTGGGWSIEAVAAIIRETAAAEILPRWRRLEKHQIREKGPGNLVTEADIEAEKVLTRRLSELLPGSAVVGEEAVAADPRRLQALDGTAPVWIVDPVDGTGNFARHSPVFGVIVALVVERRTVAGWIHEPVTGRMAWAQQRCGAWIDGQRLTMSGGTPLEAMRGSMRNFRKTPLAARVHSLSRAGCVAHDYVALASGTLHFAHYASLAPWDHAAGVLLVQEAGGHAALMDSTPYRPVVGQHGLLIAGSEAEWRQLRGMFG